MDRLQILSIPGSLREGSLQRKLLAQLQELAPETMEIRIFPLDDIPLFDEDLEAEGYPEPVQFLRDEVQNADGIILATPEYNGAMSGVIKNAVDWASRKSLLANIPVTVISGSPGPLGATKGQESLRSVVSHIGMHLMTRPFVAIPRMNQIFDGDTLSDEDTRKYLSQWLESFDQWVLKFKK